MVEKVRLSVARQHGCFVVDLRGDGRKDVVIDNGMSILWHHIREGKMLPWKEVNYPRKGEVVGFGDATGDSLPEFFVSMETEQGFLVNCYDWTGERGPSARPIYTLGPFLPPTTHRTAWGEGRVHILNCLDSNGDGRPEVYLADEPLHGEVPRVLRVFDGPTGEDLWCFEMGPMMKGVRLAGVGGGETRILLSTWSPHNGAVWNGTADSVSYVFSFTPTGQLEWLRRVTSYFAANRIEIVDIDANGRDEVVVARTFGPAELDTSQTDEPWSVAILDSRDGQIIRSRCLHTGGHDVHVADLDGDHRPELFVTGEDGRLFVMDGDLRTRLALGPGNFQKVVAVTDLDSDGLKEVVCQSSEQIVILDREGRPLAGTEHARGTRAWIARIAGEPYLLTRREYELCLSAFEPDLVPESVLWYRQFPISAAIGAAGLGVGALSVLGYGLWRERSKRRTARGAVSDEVANDLLVTMVAFGHGGASLRVIDRLRFHLKNWERRAPPGSVGEDPLTSLRSSFEESVLPDLRRIVFLARKAGVASEYWKPLLGHATHGMEELGFLLDRGSENAQERVAQALHDLDAVDRCLGGIREYLRRVFKTPLVSTVHRVIAGRQQELADAGIVSTVQVKGAFEDSVFISRTVLEKVLDGMVMNGVRAMEGREKGELGITIESEGAYVRADVKDTGCGIPEKDWERVFDRHYTTKPGGGFGLFYSREELAKFRGKIFVHGSEPGRGTTFRVILRKS